MTKIQPAQSSPAPSGGALHFTPKNLAKGWVCGTTDGHDRWLDSEVDRAKAARTAVAACSTASGATCPAPKCVSFRTAPVRVPRLPPVSRRDIEESKRGAAQAVHDFLEYQRQKKIDQLIRDYESRH